MEITDKLLEALEVKVEPFAVCDIRDGCHLDLDGDTSNTIHYTLSGYGILKTSDGSSIEVEPDQIIIVPRGMAQRIESASPSCSSTASSSICLQPSEDLFWMKAGEGATDVILACGRIQVTYGPDVDIFNQLAEPIVEFFNDSSFIRGAFEEILNEFGRPQLGTLALTSSLMKQCLIIMLRRLRQRQDQRIPWLAVLDNPRLEKALAVMLEAPQKNHRVEDLANLAHMSRSSFTEHFTKTIGQAPHEFLTGFRLRRAKQLLTVGDLNVEVIASKVGYRSRSSFSRAFKAKYGQDPMSFRKFQE